MNRHNQTLSLGFIFRYPYLVTALEIRKDSRSSTRIAKISTSSLSLFIAVHMMLLLTTLTLVVGSVLTGFCLGESSSKPPFSSCKTERLLKQWNIQDFNFQGRIHPFTNRSIDDFFGIMPQTFHKLWSLRQPVGSHGSGLVFADVGCGNGKLPGALLELYPRSQAYCLNKAGYFFHQVETVRDWVARSILHHSTIICDESDRAVVPNIVLMQKGIGQENIPIPTGEVDVVFSMFALDSGKIEPPEKFPVAIAQVLSLLKVDGYAFLYPVIHISYFQRKLNIVYPQLPRLQTGSIVDVFHLRLDRIHQYTGLVCLSSHYNNHISLIIKRCPPLFYDNSDFHAGMSSIRKWGCFAEQNSSAVLKHSLQKSSVLFGDISLEFLESQTKAKDEANYRRVVHEARTNSSYDPAVGCIGLINDVACRYTFAHTRAFFNFIHTSEYSVFV